MKIEVSAKKLLSLSTVKALGVFILEEKGSRHNLPPLLNKSIHAVVRKKLFSGKFHELLFIPKIEGKPDWFICIGLGKEKELDPARFLKTFQIVTRQIQEKKISEASLFIPDSVVNKFSHEKLGELIGEAAEIAAYRFLKYKSKEKKVNELRRLTIAVHDDETKKSIEQGVKTGRFIGESMNMTRDLGNAPSNEITPKALADFAKTIAKETGARIQVYDEQSMGKLGMGGILGVSRGSKEEAQLIVLEYLKGPKELKPIVLIGKAITFDSGGISLKPSQAMDEMKFDMSGGGAALGIIRIIGKLKLPINVVSIVPASENVPSGSSYKPGDILKTGDGTTIEVINTDAEGRIILADALIYARRYKPKAIIDLATLTYAILVALGDFAAGLFCNNDRLREDLITASQESGEKIWSMPLPKEYDDRIKSKIADVRNVAVKTGGGSITAAKFLEHFVQPKTPWAHIDIAGTAWTTSDELGQEIGATGAGIKLITAYLRNLART